VELYLSEVIKGRVVVDSCSGELKSIPGLREPNARLLRRTLYNNPVRVLVHSQRASRCTAMRKGAGSGYSGGRITWKRFSRYWLSVCTVIWGWRRGAW